MWFLGTYVTALVVMSITYWMYKWQNPECNGRLPPGSMGLPLIGETIQFFIPSKSLDIPLFVKKRIKKYGRMFKTSLAGRRVVVSSNADFNHFILQQEGKLVEIWYLDSFAELLGQNDSLRNGLHAGHIHKLLKKTIAEHLGPEILKAKLLPELEKMANHALHDWTRQEYVEVKHACSTMILKFTSKLMFGYDPVKSRENISETFATFIQGLMSFPLNIPGTAFRKCLQSRKKILKLIGDAVEESRRAYPETSRGDFLDSLINDMKDEKLVTDNLITYVIFALLLATSETIPTALTLAIKFLTEQPLVKQELVKENENIIRGRENMQTEITWNEYKAMTFTMHVINESLRMSGSSGILRRTIEDIHVHVYRIHNSERLDNAVIPSTLHMDPDTYKDPLAFNPWRWEDLGGSVKAKNFIAFGGGMRSCSGAEYSKALMAVFLHVFVTKYRSANVKGGEIVRAPMLEFRNGYYIEVSQWPKILWKQIKDYVQYRWRSVMPLFINWLHNKKHHKIKF